jgi:hypothetical protein
VVWEGRWHSREIKLKEPKHEEDHIAVGVKQPYMG